MTLKSKDNRDSAYKKRSLFGRRQGRAIKGERAEAMSLVMPQIEINMPLESNQGLSPSSLFDKEFSSYWLEIGFGQGERLAQLCRDNEDVAYIGAEPFINGMAAFLKDIQNDNKANIRVLMDDAMILARSFTEESLDGIYVLNPDPWHKKRHLKRRIINQENLDVFAKILKPGGSLVMTTDVEDLAEWMCIQASRHPKFKWSAKSKRDWTDPPKDWIKTRYEIKGAKGAKKMTYLFFKRI